MADTFTTHITFASGDTHKEDPITADKLGGTITRLIKGPAAQMGMIKEVKIVDGWDCIVFHARTPNRFEAIANHIIFPEFLARDWAAHTKSQNNSQK